MPLKEVTLYTDGSSRGNPGPGGYGIILEYQGQRKELSGGYRRTTNNRMELLAAIIGLRALKERCRVTLCTDSEYLVNAINKGWATRWRAKGWMRTADEPARNADLWEQLLQLCEQHEVHFVWIKGHAGHAENERCDQLAQEAAHREALPPDVEHEQAQQQKRPGQ